MDNSKVNKIVNNGAPTSIDQKNPQQRRVIATASKLRVQVGKSVNVKATN